MLKLELLENSRYVDIFRYLQYYLTTVVQVDDPRAAAPVPAGDPLRPRARPRPLALAPPPLPALASCPAPQQDDARVSVLVIVIVSSQL